MPPLCLHLGVAKEAASQLGHPVISDNLGSYLLGATSPDVRIITGASREETHFFPLDGDSAESGVIRLFLAHPYLADAAALDGPTRAFVAGYLSHLVTDEAWILDIYRPCFKAPTPSWGALGDMLDRALQYELDRRERLDREGMARCQALMDSLEIKGAIGFLDADTLQRWCRFVYRAAGREPNWERFRNFAERFLLSPHKVETEHLELFLASLPQLLQQTIDHVGEGRLKAFRQKVVSGSVRAAKEYLN